MSTVLMFGTFVMSVVAVILMLVVFSTGRDMLKAVQTDVEKLQVGSDFHEHSTVPVDETTDFPAVTDREPIPYDENNPPRRKIYRGEVGKRVCDCHHRFVQYEQAVYLWPRPDVAPGAMDIYCESWIQEQGARA